MLTREEAGAKIVHVCRRLYRRRSDARAVVHAHPPTATGLAVAGEAMLAPVLPELILLTGPVPLVPYATPGTAELADAIEPYLADHDALLLANHGATTMGPTLTVAHHRMECVEQAARILLAARAAGAVRELPADELARLRVRRADGRSAAS